MYFSGFLAAGLYVLSAVLVFRSRNLDRASSRGIAHTLGSLACVAHAGFIYQIFFMSNGVDLAIFPIAALVAFFVALVTLVEHLYKPIRANAIVLLVYPIVAVVIVASTLFHRPSLHAVELNFGLTLHVLSSIAAYSMLTYAACQAILLVSLDRGIRKHVTNAFLSVFPPLEEAEKVLFNALWTGLALLTISSLSGVVFFWDRLFMHPSHFHVVLSFAAWIIYAALMTAHMTFGWRGNRTTKLSLVAFALLLVGYFGSRVVLTIL